MGHKVATSYKQIFYENNLFSLITWKRTNNNENTFVLQNEPHTTNLKTSDVMKLLSGN